MKKYLRGIGTKFISLISLICLISLIQPSYAQEHAGFAVSPPSFEINANPDDLIKNTIKIENLSSGDISIKTEARNFVAYGEGGQVSLTDEESSFSISKWVKIDKDTFTISPKSFALVSFELQVPKNAEAGSHYGAIVFSTVPDSKSGQNSATVAQEIGSLILVKLPGNTYENAKLISFEPLTQFFKDPNITLNYLIENTGNVHIKPYGFITITNIFGGKTKSIEIKGHNILPGSKRLVSQDFKLDGIGPYKADLNLLYSGGGRLIRGQTQFVALNLPKLKTVLIILGILILVYLVLRKRINRAI